MLPPLVRAQAPLWPSYHLNALAQSALGFDTGSAWPHVLWLAVFTAGVLAIAVRRLRHHG